MAKKGTRIVIGLACSECKYREYVTEKNKLNTPEKLLLKKYCSKCKKVTDHKQIDKLK